jgi:hypothetical protein
MLYLIGRSLLPRGECQVEAAGVTAAIRRRKEEKSSAVFFFFRFFLL